MTIQRVKETYRMYAPKPPYIMQQEAGATMAVIGIVALLFPATRELLQLHPALEWVLFAANAVLGLALLLARQLAHIRLLLFAAFGACLATALAYTFALGVNTATGIYLVEAYFILKLISRVWADMEIERGAE